MANQTYNGHCLCGAVTFTVQPVRSNIGACHCGMCRRWTSGPFMVIECGTSFRADNEDHLGVYESSGWAERAFCTKCGSSLYYALKDGRQFVSVGAIDGLQEVTLTDEVFVDEKPDYYDFAQQTNKMTGPELIALFAEQDN